MLTQQFLSLFLFQCFLAAFVLMDGSTAASLLIFGFSESKFCSKAESGFSEIFAHKNLKTNEPQSQVDRE